jgi:hypothetical protein
MVGNVIKKRDIEEKKTVKKTIQRDQEPWPFLSPTYVFSEFGV